MEYLALDLVELHEVHTGSPLKPLKVPVDGISSLQCSDCTTQFGVIGRLAEGALDPLSMFSKGVKQHQYQYRLRKTLVTGLHLDIKSLSTTL